MSKKTALTLAIVICAGILIGATAMGALGFRAVMGANYEHAEEYSVGDADISESIRNLDVNWTDGKVKIDYHSGKDILLREQSKKKISEDRKLRWWLDGDTLRVQYEKPGFHLGFWDKEKDLTVTLPEDLIFENVSIGASSADLEIPALKAENVSFDVTSGDIDAAVDAAKISAGATSGEISLKTEEDAEAISVGTTSGDISITVGNVDAMSVSATSGEIEISGGRVKDLDAGATSGDMEIKLDESEQVSLGGTSSDIELSLGAFGSLKIDTTSGEVEAELPSKPGFTAELRTTSGDIKYDLPMSAQGSTYVCGDGSGKVDIGTTSGDIKLSE